MSTLTRTVLEATSGLAASPVSASAINLTWTANTRATGYRVYRNGTLIASPTTNSYSDSGLTASTSYTYSVSTVAASGEGPQTAGVQGTTLAAPDTTAPTAPVITATATGQTTISVALTTPATDAQSGVASYDLDYKTAAAGTYTTITPVTAGQFPYIIGGLSAATTHNTRARARDTVGNIGAYSAVSNATTQASTGTNYAWYTALDLSTIPFHAASGPWGAAFPVQAPTAPTTTLTATLSSPSSTSANVSGTRYTVAANLNSLTVSGTDIEVIIPPGFSCGQLSIGGTRIRIRGSTVGVHSGGQFRGVTAGTCTDLILDGFKIGSPGTWWANVAVDLSSNSNNRVAFVNMKVRAHQLAMTCSGDHWVYAGNSILAGEYTWGQITGLTSGTGANWSVRHGLSASPVIFFRNDIRGRRFHRMRSGIAWLYMTQNQIVDLQESAITLVVGTPGSGVSTSPFAMVTDNDIYAYEAGGGARMNVDGAMYGRITGNRIRSNAVTAGYLAGQQSAHLSLRPTANVDYVTGNVHSAFVRPSSWIGAGDPSDVTLEGGEILDPARHAEDLIGLAP